ncbi:MAG TPA: hypothetical protein VOA87_10360 [Thermoanaerobaculia bacterium]|nr:hypothetical protein [Thermoanaerobaculia bacterium]
MKLPRFKLPALKDVTRPTRWDLAAIAVLAVGLILTGANLAVARAKPVGEPFPDGATALFVFTQLAVSLGGLLLLGKTAKEGTGWGNLASILSMFVGMSGVLLAAALWAAA